MASPFLRKNQDREGGVRSKGSLPSGALRAMNGRRNEGGPEALPVPPTSPVTSFAVEPDPTARYTGRSCRKPRGSLDGDGVGPSLQGTTIPGTDKMWLLNGDVSTNVVVVK